MSDLIKKLEGWGREIAPYLGLKFLKSTGLDPHSEEPRARLVFTDEEKIILYETDPTKITWVGNLSQCAEAEGERLNIKVPFFPTRYLQVR